MVVLFYHLLKDVDLAQVWANIRAMTWREDAILVVLAAWNLASYALVWMAVTPGLGFGRAMVMTQAATAVTNTVPTVGPAIGVGMTYTMFRSWGISGSTTDHVRGGYGKDHHAAAPLAGVCEAARHRSALQAAVDTIWPRVRTPSVQTTVVPEAADGQSADRLRLWSIASPGLLRGVMLDPMIDNERALLERRWAVRVSLPDQASHAAQVARRLVEATADAHLDAPAVVVRAVGALEGTRSPSTSGCRPSGPSWSAAAWMRPPSSGTWNAAP